MGRRVDRRAAGTRTDLAAEADRRQVLTIGAPDSNHRVGARGGTHRLLTQVPVAALLRLVAGSPILGGIIGAVLQNLGSCRESNDVSTGEWRRESFRAASVDAMTDRIRDYVAWHDDYDDPGSTLSWRLGMVRAAIGTALDGASGAVQLISACAGDGRDVLGVLARRDDAGRVRATLLELHPVIAARAHQAVIAAGLATQVKVLEVDAGHSDAYLGVAPAEVVLLVGIFGNISSADLQQTIASSPQLCSAGAILIWTRGRGGELTDRNDEVRSWFSVAGFTELNYQTLEQGSRPAVGIVRYDGPQVPLTTGRRWFTFER